MQTIFDEGIDPIADWELIHFHAYQLLRIKNSNSGMWRTIMISWHNAKTTDTTAIGMPDIDEDDEGIRRGTMFTRSRTLTQTKIPNTLCCLTSPLTHRTDG